MRIIFPHELDEPGYICVNLVAGKGRESPELLVDEFIIFFSCNAFLRPTLI